MKQEAVQPFRIMCLTIHQICMAMQQREALMYIQLNLSVVYSDQRQLLLTFDQHKTSHNQVLDRLPGFLFLDLNSDIKPRRGFRTISQHYSLQLKPSNWIQLSSSREIPCKIRELTFVNWTKNSVTLTGTTSLLVPGNSPLSLEIEFDKIKLLDLCARNYA